MQRKIKFEMKFSFIFLILSGLYTYLFIDSSFMIQPLIRAVFFLVFAVALHLIGYKVVPYMLVLFSLMLTVNIKFIDLTPFFILCLGLAFSGYSKNFCYSSLFLYATDVLVVCIRHEKTPVHLIIHLIYCLSIYFATKKIFETYKSNDFTPKENQILRQIAVEGKSLKEIQGLKANTVSKILKKCRERHNCKSNKDLYLLYRRSIKNQ